MTHRPLSLMWCVVPGMFLLGGVAFSNSVHLRWLLAAGVAVLVLAAFLLDRRSTGEHIEQLARYIAQVPGLPATTPALPSTFALPLTATQHVARDVTAQQLAAAARRQQLEILLEGMQDAVLGLDAAGRVQWSNAHMQRLLFRDAAGAALRQGRSLVHTFRNPELLAAVQRTLDEAEPSECRSDAIVPGRIFQVNASPLPEGGAVVVLHDITRAEQMERSQRDFVANVSHELRTPLTSIIGYVETVMDGESLTPPALDFLNTALKNASRMQRLTEDLLLISQTEQPEQAPLLQRLPLRPLLEDALRTVAGASYAEGAALEILACTPGHVLADAHAIMQVLGNLLENAVKYSRTGSAATPVRVQLYAAALADDPGYIQVNVKDFGPGIALEHLSRIFDRFYRVEKARSRAVGGTGLGLSIARKLVEQHGGRMWAESVLGQGSTFCFTLRTAD